MYRDAPLSMLHHSDLCSEACYIILTSVRKHVTSFWPLFGSMLHHSDLCSESCYIILTSVRKHVLSLWPVFGMISLWITKGHSLSWLLSIVVILSPFRQYSTFKLDTSFSYQIPYMLEYNATLPLGCVQKKFRKFGKCNIKLKDKGVYYTQLTLTLSLEYWVRKNSAITCLSSYYWLGNDMSLTCYWERRRCLACKATPTFLCGYFRKTKLRPVLGLIQNSKVHMNRLPPNIN
jgi:predicted nucleic acid-binding Zn ribbon protein